MPDPTNTEQAPVAEARPRPTSGQGDSLEPSPTNTGGLGIEHAPPPAAFDSPLEREVALAQLEAAVLGKDPTLLRRQSEPASASEVHDPVLEASIRNRVAAIAALAGVVYSVAVPLDLGLHAMFQTSGLTSPARLKNLFMAVLSWGVYRAAHKVSLSRDTVAQLAFLFVFAVGLHQTLESLHFFQFPDQLRQAGHAAGAEAPSNDRPQSADEVLRLLEQLNVDDAWDDAQLRTWWSTVSGLQPRDDL